MSCNGYVKYLPDLVWFTAWLPAPLQNTQKVVVAQGDQAVSKASVWRGGGGLE